MQWILEFRLCMTSSWELFFLQKFKNLKWIITYEYTHTNEQQIADFVTINLFLDYIIQNYEDYTTQHIHHIFGLYNNNEIEKSIEEKSEKRDKSKSSLIMCYVSDTLQNCKWKFTNSMPNLSDQMGRHFSHIISVFVSKQERFT